jgi:hypothetical protein
MEVDRLVFDAMAHGKPKPQDNQMAKPHPFCQRLEPPSPCYGVPGDNAFHPYNSRGENFFAPARRSRLKLLDASDGAANRKNEKEKGCAYTSGQSCCDERLASPRAVSGGVSLDAVDTHA